MYYLSLFELFMFNIYLNTLDKLKSNMINVCLI